MFTAFLEKRNFPMGEIKLAVTVEKPGISTVTIQGELDLYSTSDVKIIVQDCLNNRNPKLLMDLTGLEYLDSSGVGLLISIIQTIKQKSGALRVIGLHGSPKLVLEMCKILPLIPQCNSKEEGLKELSQII
jgi:anti-sigma B factor antagonist